MPITPLHLGPGTLLKSADPSRFSLIAFSACQFVIDLEPLYHLLRGERLVHRFFHSILGSLVVSTAVALVVLLARRPVASVLANRLPAVVADLATPAVWLGSALGGLSHVLLDWLMHSDIRLFYPSSLGESAGGLIGIREMYLGCVLAGIVGLFVLVGRWRHAV